MRVIYGLDTKSIEDFGQVVIIDIPVEYSENTVYNGLDMEEYIENVVNDLDVTYVSDLLDERTWAKWHFESQDEGELSDCPACGATWESLHENGSTLMLMHTDGCRYVEWRDLVGA